MTLRTLIFAGVMGLALTGTVRADDDDVEDVGVEEVQPARAAQAPDGVAGILGKLHPAVVHLPIAWLLLLWLVDLYTLGWKKTSPVFGALLLFGTVLSFLPGLLSGYLRAEQLEALGEKSALLETHHTLIFISAALAAAALAFRLMKRNMLTGAARWPYLLLITAAVLLIGYGGHVGGKMVFGADYLPF